MRRSTWPWVAALLLAGGAAGASDDGGARALLERAFANRYELDFMADIDLVMHGAQGRTRVRSFRALSKVIDGLTHSVGRLTTPHYLRGMTILTIEAEARGHDSFVFLPALDKIRRVSTAQRTDAFLGSDITYEDLERRRASEYEITSHRIADLHGERVREIGAAPRQPGAWDRIEFVIAQSDAAILETRHYRGGELPRRIVSTSRADMLTQAGHVLPLRIFVVNASRASRTEVVFRNLVVNPEIDARIFSLVTLDQARRLPGETP